MMKTLSKAYICDAADKVLASLHPQVGQNCFTCNIIATGTMSSLFLCRFGYNEIERGTGLLKE